MSNTLVALLSDNSVLLTGLDFFAKSTAVLLLTFTASYLVRVESFRARNQHLLFLIGLGCLALIPVVSNIPLLFLAEPDFQVTLLTLPTFMDSRGETYSAPDTSFSSNSLLLLIYLTPCLLLLSRIVFAVRSVFGIGSRATGVPQRKVVESASRVARSLEISRPVTILVSKEITSPFSFGISAPKIVLPEQANDWSQSVLEDVLVHEMMHIKRLDWPTTLICHLVASLYWINPLCWLAVNRISEEAENSCDAAVLSFGKNHTDYAANLMLIARQSRDGKRLLTQMMADNSMLTKRVQRILKGRARSSENNTFLPILTSILFALLLSFGNVQTLALESSLQARSEAIDTLKTAPTFIVAPRFGVF